MNKEAEVFHKLENITNEFQSSTFCFIQVLCQFNGWEVKTGIKEIQFIITVYGQPMISF